MNALKQVNNNYEKHSYYHIQIESNHLKYTRL